MYVFFTKKVNRMEAILGDTVQEESSIVCVIEIVDTLRGRIKMLTSKTYIAIPPGETIKEMLDDRGMTQKELATRMGLTEKHISQLINGQVSLTLDVASRLESVLGVSIQTWLNLEAIYRERIYKVNEENRLMEEEKLAKAFPYGEMAKRGWVPQTRKAIERVSNLRRFFEVASLDLVWSAQPQRVAYRKLANTEKSDSATLAWLQRVRLDARMREAKRIDEQKLKGKLPQIRAMIGKRLREFFPELQELLADCGAVLICEPHIQDSYLHGATFREGNKIVVGIAIRGRDADRFWFSLFHELGHIVLGHINSNEKSGEEMEAEVNRFAEDALIPRRDWEGFVQLEQINVPGILNLSKKADIPAGIVVGRLQKAKYVGFDEFNELKEKYDWEEFLPEESSADGKL